MQLIVISNAEELPGEAAIINNLFQAGMSLFHLRKPGSNTQQLCALLDNIDAAFYNRIALHQYHELAPAYGITRLHYTEQMRRRMEVDEWKDHQAKGCTLSTSIHDVAAIHQSLAFDYVFFGPVFNSLSKPGYNSTPPLGFKLNKENIKPKVIAIGGIESSTILPAKAMGFNGAAVLGAIWSRPEKAIGTFEKLQEIITTV